MAKYSATLLFDNKLKNKFRINSIMKTKKIINNKLIKIYKCIVGNRRIDKLSALIVNNLPHNIKSLLDFGCGTGQIAFNLSNARPNMKIVGVDTLIRADAYIKVRKYEGQELPFKNSSFDVVMAIDVLHHTDKPREVFNELVRVASKYIIIKDHIANSEIDRVILKFMDYVGNRIYDVKLPYNYLSRDEWDELIASNNLIIESLVTNFDLYPFPLNSIFGGSLHSLFVLKVNE
jgi:SAM-dependent methyltransferase